ncbi:MAG: cytochrome-c oxidase, cbb3-type subunit III [Pseudomonadota bacterium]
MSDFLSNFWSMFIAIVTVLSIVGVLVFLRAQSTRKVIKNKEGETTDTGHRWDGDLRELNNPMPRWWLVMFYLGILFGAAYLALYPGLGAFKGVKNLSSLDEYEQERKQVEEASKPVYTRFMKLDVPHLAKDAEARAIGQRLFLNVCAQCHGSDAEGAKGFPNLTDKDWLYGGEPETIRATIAKGRHGVMPPFGQVLGAEKIQDVANYVRAFSGLSVQSARVVRGYVTFQSTCAACHGPEGKGNQALGAPNLTDDVWLYGSSEKTIIETITKGRNNQMPAHEEKLTPEKIHLLTAYIWGFSNSHASKE